MDFISFHVYINNQSLGISENYLNQIGVCYKTKST